ncbi:ATP phosphoribosyltransferase [Candidatus Micrarchaeota archaeon]|nr:ATP phosphoribosyltransferase [Candidatus Micrarchaeota archaeon]
MIRLAIPSKGRVNADTLRLLEKIGLDIPQNGRKLYVNTNNPDIQIVYARAADIPLYVQSGAADIGITGEDMINESRATVQKLLKLNFGKCRIVVAALKDSNIKSVKDYRGGMKAATKLTNIAKDYFANKNLFCEIVRVAGATEIAPYLNIADLIIDQVSTGTTLAENNLRIIDTIQESYQFLIANEKCLKEKEEEIDSLKLSIEAVITAEAKRYIMVNVVGEEKLKRVVSAMPAMESPTILELAKPGTFSVHSVVDSAELISAIRKIKKAGAKDILVMNMSKVVG